MASDEAETLAGVGEFAVSLVVLALSAFMLADPAGILDRSPAGGHDLYVAITRATHRLTIVHDTPLPATLSRLTDPPPHP